jgi:acyl CoA:acetate/3-ketoacid CoA transferase
MLNSPGELFEATSTPACAIVAERLQRKRRLATIAVLASPLLGTGIADAVREVLAKEFQHSSVELFMEAGAVKARGILT